MSVPTRADENLDKIKSLLDEARDLLYETAMQECWGWEEYKKEYQEQVTSAFSDLVHVISRIKR